MNKTILVTGGAGYIGSHTFAELVAAGYDPVIVDNFSNSEKRVIDRLKELTKADVRLYEGDCNDARLMAQIFEAEEHLCGVIHFAAYKAVGESVAEPLKYYTNNIGSLMVLLNTMQKFGVRPLVFSSSCTVYGVPDELPVTEASPTKPGESPYGNTKRICEEMIADCIHCQAPIKAISLRYFNPIGAHPSSLIGELPIGIPNNLIPFVTQTAAGIRNQLTIFGDDYDTPDGTCIRDYIHVVDLAQAHVKAMDYLLNIEAPCHYDTINVGTGKGNSVKEVVTCFEAVTAQKLNYVVGDRRPGDVPAVYANADKARDVLGFEAVLSLQEALRDAWAWQRSLQE